MPKNRFDQQSAMIRILAEGSAAKANKRRAHVCLIKREQCLQFIVPRFASFCANVLLHDIFCTVGEGEGRIVLLSMCNTMLWCEKSPHEWDQHNLFFVFFVFFRKDLDYESKRKLFDVPTSRLCSELVDCKTMPLLPTSIGQLVVQ